MERTVKKSDIKQTVNDGEEFKISKQEIKGAVPPILTPEDDEGDIVKPKSEATQKGWSELKSMNRHNAKVDTDHELRVNSNSPGLKALGFFGERLKIVYDQVTKTWLTEDHKMIPDMSNGHIRRDPKTKEFYWIRDVEDCILEEYEEKTSWWKKHMPDPTNWRAPAINLKIKLDEAVGNKVERLIELGESSLNVVEQFKDSQVKKIYDGTVNFLGDKDDESFIRWITDFLSTITLTLYNASKAATKTDSGLIILQSLMASGVVSTYTVAKKISHFLVELIGKMGLSEKPNVMTFQGKDDKKKKKYYDISKGEIVEDSEDDKRLTHILWESIVSMMESVAGFFTNKDKAVKMVKTDPPKKDSAWFKNMASGIKEIKNVGQGIEYIINSAWNIVCWVYLKVFGKPLYMEKDKVLIEEASQWIVEMRRMIDLDKPGSMSMSSSFCQEIQAHVKKAESIQQRLTEAGFVKANFYWFNDVYKIGKQLADKAQTIMKTAKNRQPPVVIQLSGPPGAGKSGMASMLCADLMAWYAEQTGTKNEGVSTPWPRLIDNEYWDGYNHQFCVVYDDYMQVDDPDVRVRIAREVIDMNNSMPYLLHMSKAEEKDQYYFDSKLVILTSNSTTTPTLKLQDKEAFLRRRDLLLHVDVEGQDPTKSGVRKIQGPYTRKSYACWKVDPISERCDFKLEDKMTYVDVLTEVCSLFIRKMDEGSSISDFLQVKKVTDEYKDIKLPKLVKNPFVVRLPVACSKETKEEYHTADEGLRPESVVLTMQGKDDDEPVKETDNCKAACDFRLAQDLLCTTYPGKESVILQKGLRVPVYYNFGLGKLWVQPKGYYGKSVVPAQIMPLDSDLPLTLFSEFLDMEMQGLKKRTESILNEGKDPAGYKQSLRDAMAACDLSMLGLERMQQVIEKETDTTMKQEPKLRWLYMMLKVMGIAGVGLLAADLLRRWYNGDYEDNKLGRSLANMLRNQNMKAYKGEDPFVHPGDPGWRPWYKRWWKPYEDLELREQEFKEKFEEWKNSGEMRKDSDRAYDKYVLTMKEGEKPIGREEYYKIFVDQFAMGYSGSGSRIVDPTFRKKQHSRQQARHRKIQRFRTVTMQGDENSREVLRNAVYPNAGDFYITSEDGQRHSCYMVFIKNWTFLTVRHMFLHAKAGISKIGIRPNRDNKWYEFKFDDCDIIEDSENDSVLVTVPKNGIQPFKDISKHFITEDELYSLDISTCVMLIPNEEKLEFNSCTGCSTNQSLEYVMPGFEDVAIGNIHAISYSAMCDRGDCGAVISIDNTRAPRKLVGIHVAGKPSARIGSATVVSQEFLMESFELIEGAEEGWTPHGKDIDSDLKIEIDTDAEPCFVYNEGVEFRGAVAPELAHRFPSKSEIIPSLIHGNLMETRLAPAMLNPRGGIKPVQNALVKVGQPIGGKQLDPILCSEIAEMMVFEIPSLVKPVKLTLQEAISGKPEWKHIASLHMGTSGGFRRQGGTRQGGKKDFFNLVQHNGQSFWAPRESLKNDVQWLESMYRSGKTGLTICELNLKDELRTLDRVAAGKTRIIVSQELAHLLLGRMYFGAFMEAAAEHHIQAGIFIGLNPHSVEWKAMVDRVSSLEDVNVWDMDGDAENYDWTTEPSTVEQFITFVERWYIYYSKVHCIEYDPLDGVVRRGLIYDCCRTVHMLVGKDLIRLKKAFLSGSFITALMNSFNGRFEHHYCFLKCARKLNSLWLQDKKLECLEYFFDGQVDVTDEKSIALFDFCRRKTNDFDIDTSNVKKFFLVDTGGDDFVARGNTASKWYTFKKMKVKMLKYFTRKYTATDKKEELGDGHKPFLHATYLGRGFRREGGLVFAPMAIEDLLDQLNWVSNKLDPRIALFWKAQSVIRELFHHGRDVYDEWKTKINVELTRVGIFPVTYSWDTLLRAFTDAKDTRGLASYIQRESEKQWPGVEIGEKRRWEVVWPGEDLSYRVMSQGVAHGRDDDDFEYILTKPNPKCRPPSTADYDYRHEIIYANHHGNFSCYNKADVFCMDEGDYILSRPRPGKGSTTMERRRYARSMMTADQQYIFQSAEMRGSNILVVKRRENTDWRKRVEVFSHGKWDQISQFAHGLDDYGNTLYGIIGCKPKHFIEGGQSGHRCWGEAWGHQFSGAGPKARDAFHDAMKDLMLKVGLIDDKGKINMACPYLNYPILAENGVYYKDRRQADMSIYAQRLKDLPLGKKPAPVQMNANVGKPPCIEKVVEETTKLRMNNDKPVLDAIEDSLEYVRWKISEDDKDIAKWSEKIAELDYQKRQHENDIADLTDKMMALQAQCVKLDANIHKINEKIESRRPKLKKNQDKEKRLLQELYSIKQIAHGKDDGTEEPTVGVNTQDSASNIEQKNLTVLQDIEPLVEQMTGAIRQPVFENVDPYPHQELGTVLERYYRITDITWSGADAAGATKGSFFFPYTLMQASTNLKEKLSYFKYFKADVEVEFRINSTTFHFGQLMAGWAPQADILTSAKSQKMSNLYGLSTCNACFISANARKSVRITIPWVSPVQFMDTATSTNNVPYIGTLVVMVLNPLKVIAATTTPSVQVSVFAKFVNIKVAGPSLQIVTLRQEAIKEGEKALKEKQERRKLISGFNKMEAHGGSPKQQRTITNGQAKIQVERPKRTQPRARRFVYTEEHHKRKAERRQLMADEKFRRDMEYYRNFLQMLPYEAHGKTGTHPANPEQKAKTEKGTVSSALEKVGTVSAMVASTGLAGPFTPVAEGVSVGASLLGQVASFFGYNKPLSLKASEPVALSLTSGMSHGSGMMTTQDLSLIPENATSNDSKNFGLLGDFHQLQNLFTRPGYVETIQFDSTSAVGAVIRTYHVTPMTAASYIYTYTTGKTRYLSYHTPCSLVGYNFKQWRGTMKYYFQIVCSQYTTGRLRFSWHPTIGEVPANFTDGEGDFISKVVDFSGDTNVCISIPYLQQAPYKRCEDTWSKNDTGTNGALAISIVNAVTSSTTVGDSTVQLNMFCAGDKDMDFVQLYERELISGFTRGPILSVFSVPSSGAVAQGNDEDMSTNLDDIFSADFPSLVPAKAAHISFLCEGEKIKDILTILHRFVRYTPTSNTLLSNGVWNQFLVDGLTSNVQNDSALSLFSAWFLYRRGSFNWKFVRDYQATAVPNGLLTATLEFWDTVISAWVPISTLSNPSGRNGTVVEDTTYRPSLEIKMPWVNTQAYVENYNVRLNTTDEVSIAVKFNSFGGSTATDSTWVGFVAVGDDFSFGWPVGVPAVAMTQT